MGVDDARTEPPVTNKNGNHPIKTNIASNYISINSTSVLLSPSG